jgi:hypothetical protein
MGDDLKNQTVKQYVPPAQSEPKQSEKEKVLEAIEVGKLNLELEAQKLKFKNLAEFESRLKALDAKEVELARREDKVKTEEDILVQREAEVVRAAEINDNVKQNLISKEILDYKKSEKVRAYAFQSYFNTLDILFQKLLNAKSGKSCLGLVPKGKKLVDETVCIDVDFQDELKPLIISVMTALKVSPKFKTDTGEYITQDESEEEYVEDEPDSDA